jgi:phage terminase Nu1 subunit (DNA packaging protein)
MPTVDSWIRAGCPYLKRGGRGVEWQFDTAKVSTWMTERAVSSATGTAKADESELRRRRLEADTGLAELELLKAKGLVAPIAQFERAMASAFAELRTKLRNIPANVISVLIGETNERQFKKVLLEEIDDALEALANADLCADDEDEDGDKEGGE